MNTFAKVSGLLSDTYTVARGRGDSVRVELTALKTKGNRLNLVKKVQLLQAAQKTLNDGGLDVQDDDIRDGYLGRDGNWVSWPHIWVQQSREAQSNIADVVAAEVRKALAEIGAVRAESEKTEVDADGDSIVTTPVQEEEPF